MAGDFDATLAVLKDPSSNLPASALGLLYRGSSPPAMRATASPTAWSRTRVVPVRSGNAAVHGRIRNRTVPFRCAGGSRDARVSRREGSAHRRADLSRPVVWKRAVLAQSRCRQPVPHSGLPLQVAGVRRSELGLEDFDFPEPTDYDASPEGRSRSSRRS